MRNRERGTANSLPCGARSLAWPSSSCAGCVFRLLQKSLSITARNHGRREGGRWIPYFEKFSGVNKLDLENCTKENDCGFSDACSNYYGVCSDDVNPPSLTMSTRVEKHLGPFAMACAIKASHSGLFSYRLSSVT